MRVILVASVVLILSSSFFGGVLAQDDEQPDVIEYLVASQTVNLRSGPGTNYSIVGTASEGESLLIYNETPEVAGWLRIYRAEEEDAYIADFLVDRAPTRFYSVTQEPIATFSGRGNQISDSIDLPSGAYRFDAVVSDNLFTLRSHTVSGDCRDQTVFNALSYDSNSLVLSALFISDGCSVVLETDNVDGAWEIEVRDLLDEALLEDLLTIDNNTSISGKSQALTMPTMLPKGAWSISATVNGNAFILFSRVLTGDCDEKLVMDEMDFDVNVLEAFSVYRSNGCIIFWETAGFDGNWEISFKKLD